MNRAARRSGALALLCLAGCQPGCPPPVDDAGDAPDAPGDASDASDVASTARVGDPCTGAPAGGAPERGSCAPGQLCQTDDDGYPGGYCVAPCATRGCPADAACVTLGAQRTCLHACATNADCRFAERYRCTPVAGGGSVCLPIDAPTGLRDGAACYTTTPGPHQLAPLARRTFSAANLAASGGRADTSLAAEGNVAIAPAPRDGVTAPYISISAAGQAFIGLTTARAAGATLARAGSVRDDANTDATDPVVAFTRDGVLHAVFVGLSFDSLGRPRTTRVRIADSTDEGQTFGAVRDVGACAAPAESCDKPWIAVGPAAPGAPARDAVYVAYAVSRDGASALVVQRSDDAGATFGPRVEIAPAGMVDSGVGNGAPELPALAVGGDGTVHAAWLSLGAARGTFGDPGNRVIYRRSTDGAQTFEPPRVVSEPGESVVYQPPALAVTGALAHVAYVAGSPSGAWDVRLASTADGGASVARRRVNDEPDGCATHFLPALAADAASVHVLWLENRFGDGAVAYSACPLDARSPCSANELVSDQPFTFATTRDPRRWHGDYAGLAFDASGALWAAWSDTRTGSPAVYLARGTPH